ncbi:hypothetical protein ACH5RR_023441 [Cinchona calisaya]|uniref:SWIM-type domain-containing protein n=1 Tax=Cinchona calisaya TaxID=153742 RepID=A0ABD2ZAN9_9GENT
MADAKFRLKIHYGGQFPMFGANNSCVRGKISYVDSVDQDCMSFIELLGIVKNLGFPTTVNLYHLIPDADMNGGLRMIFGDNDVLDMFAMHAGRETIDVYVDHFFMFDTMNSAPVQVNNGNAVENTAYNIEAHVEAAIDFNHGDDVTNMYDVNINEVEELKWQFLWQFQLVEDDIYAGSFAHGAGPSHSVGSSHGAGPSKPILNGEGTSNVATIVNNISDDEGELKTPRGSDDENVVEFPVFNEEKDMTNPILLLGMVFQNATVFRAALRENSINNGFDFKYVKNDGDRVTAICMDDCPRRIYASKMHGSNTFQIKSLIEHRVHPKRYKIRGATSWLANKYMDKLVDDPSWNVKAIQRSVRREFSVFMSRGQSYRAKRKALEAIEGNHKEQFSRVRDYCEMILRQNLGSVARVKVERPLPYSAAQFQRMFVMFDAQKKGFLGGCRPVIGLDACHLKGPFGGQLMHADGRNGNNQMYPLALAVVEIENKDSWMWFIELLLECIGRPEEMGWIFISDRQKGLKETFNAIMPGVEHRFSSIQGKDLKDLIWRAASANTLEEHREHMNALRVLNQSAHDWLLREPPYTWARSHFSPRSKCDMISNNISESFNQWVKEARDKPVITMMEMIRRQLMSRYQEKKDMISKSNGHICPRIQKNIEEIKIAATCCEVSLAGEAVYEVVQGQKFFIVDVRRRSCICRKFDMTGIPCLHGAAAIMSSNHQVEEFVHEYYWKTTYLKAYEHMIVPIPDKSQWIQTDYDPIMPPQMRRAPGRPKKARRKGIDEPENNTLVRRHFQQLRSSNCGNYDHNIKTCEAPRKQKKTAQNFQGGRGSAPNTKESMNHEVAGVKKRRGRGNRRGRGRGSFLSGHGNPLGQNGETFSGEHISTIMGRGRAMAYKDARTRSNITFSTVGQSAVNSQGQACTHVQLVRSATRFGDIFLSQGSRRTFGSTSQQNSAIVTPNISSHASQTTINQNQTNCEAGP